jgi:signal transduction histidine kinase
MDITQLERLGRLFGDGLVLGTPDGRVLAATPRAGALLGLPAGAAPARVAALLAEAAPGEPHLSRAARAAFEREDVRCAGADGRVRRLRLAGLPLAAGDRVVAALVLRELPEPPPLAEPLPLAPEIRRLQELRDEILSIASHELKNPLTVILGYGAMLAGAAEIRIHPRLARAADAVLQQSQRMRYLVDQLLDLSRLELGRLTLLPAPFDVAELARAVAGKVAEGPLGVSVEGAPLVALGDAMRIERVLVSLLTGALRHRAKGAEVSISLRRVGAAHLPEAAYGWRAPAGMYVQVQICAPGLHVEWPDLHAIVARNTDAEALRAEHRLSMYIGAQVILLHGGLIWVEPGHPAGAAVCYALPLAA